MHERTALMAMILTLATGIPASATSVVVLRSADVLVAAVDSKETYERYGEEGMTREGRMCKVARSGPYYVLVSGLTRGWLDSDSGPLDIIREIEESYAPHGDTPDASMEALASRLWNGISPKLEIMLEAIRRKDESAFASRYLGAAALQLMVVGVEGRRPAAKVLEFQVATDPGGRVRIVRHVMGCPGDCANPNSAYFLGVHGEIDAFLAGNRNFIAKPDERKAETLIRLSYRERPDLVGGPVSLLRADRAGVEVVDGGVCGFARSTNLRTRSPR